MGYFKGALYYLDLVAQIDPRYSEAVFDRSWSWRLSNLLLSLYCRPLFAPCLIIVMFENLGVFFWGSLPLDLGTPDLFVALKSCDFFYLAGTWLTLSITVGTYLVASKYFRIKGAEKRKKERNRGKQNWIKIGTDETDRRTLPLAVQKEIWYDDRYR